MNDSLAACRRAIAAAPLPERLDGIEADIFAAIEAAADDDRGRRRATTLAIGGALALGLVGGGVAGSTAGDRADTPMAVDALAPSTLLLGR